MKNKCWVSNCNRKCQEGFFTCRKHNKKNVKIKVPGIKAFDNTPTKV